MHINYSDGSGLLISTERSLLDIDVIHDFLANHAYWSPGVPRSTVERSIAGSLPFGVYDTGATAIKQIGFARVISDYATFAYIADVFIVEDYRGRGLSKWLIGTIRAYPDLQGLRSWVLRTRDAHSLYAQFGFQPLDAPERWMIARDG